jgi:hypothetical protein
MGGLRGIPCGPPDDSSGEYFEGFCYDEVDGVINPRLEK